MFPCGASIGFPPLRFNNKNSAALECSRKSSNFATFQQVTGCRTTNSQSKEGSRVKIPRGCAAVTDDNPLKQTLQPLLTISVWEGERED